MIHLSLKFGKFGKFKTNIIVVILKWKNSNQKYKGLLTIFEKKSVFFVNANLHYNIVIFFDENKVFFVFFGLETPQ